MNENPTDPRAAMRRALDVAAAIADVCPVQDYDSITTTRRSIVIQAHNRPADVAEFAETLDLVLALKPRNGRPYIEAVGDVDGLTVTVWALGEAGQDAEYKAAAAPVALPAAWSAKAVAA